MNWRCLFGHEWETQFLSPFRRCRRCPHIIERSHLSGFLLDGEWDRVTVADLPEEHEWRSVADLAVQSVPGKVLDGERVS